MHKMTAIARVRVMCHILAVTLGMATLGHAQEDAYHVGCGSADITGPVVGVQFWGFVRADQIGAGLHLRQRARAFLVVDPQREQRLAFVVCDLGSITHELHREVVDRLQKEFGDTYTLENVILSATHTHAAPGGFWHAGVGTPFGSPLHEAYFNVIAGGIVSGIKQAHESLQPGVIRIAEGDVVDAGVNRSRVAYLNNPADERAQYDADNDTRMTLLRFETAAGPIGCLNWFAVHPTTMTFNNKLVSGDHKGFAEVTFEREQGVTYQQPGEFVAAFAQSNCGDVTGNLNLNNTGPGVDEFETTRIIGERQLITARELFAEAKEPLSGPFGVRQAFVNLSAVEVTDEFAGGTPQSTAPAAYGYAFAAGSTEDGGGHPLFKEGMTEKIEFIELTLNAQFPDARPSEEFRSRHRPKAILIAPGEMKPQSGIGQTLSLTVARIGSLAIVAGPAEFTTMSGRRIRQTVKAAMGDGVQHVVIAGYSNGYAGYVTTFEEYQTQQYEGGHTLFGPWTLAAYQQEYARLASSLSDDRAIESTTAEVTDLGGKIESTTLGTKADVPPTDAAFGDVITQPAASYKRGETASVEFWTSNPQNAYPQTASYATVEQQSGMTWTSIATDADWSTRCTFSPNKNVAKPYKIKVTWEIPEVAVVGKYRIVHHSQARGNENGETFPVSGISDVFTVE